MPEVALGHFVFLALLSAGILSMLYNLVMSWASRRRTTYLIGVFVFLALIFGVPIYSHFYKPASCSDGKRNQGETAPDKGGPCILLDERALAPASVLWARSFAVRPGAYNSVAYIENANENAGVRAEHAVHYRFGMYDSKNILVAERTGATFILPGSITPIFEANIEAGNREIAHTYFEFTEPFIWERVNNPAKAISVSNREVSSVDTIPRVEATAENTSVSAVFDPSFAIVVFDPSGTARAASKTSSSRLAPGEKQLITFTWPKPFSSRVGRVDIFPLLSPSPFR